MLSRYGRIILIDGTFDLTEGTEPLFLYPISAANTTTVGKQVVTSVCVFIDEVWVVPCAFLVHSNHTANTYTQFLHYLFSQEGLQGHALPNAVIGDYEEALKLETQQAFSENVR